MFLITFLRKYHYTQLNNSSYCIIGIECRSDLLILKTIKQSVEMRNSVCHSATIYANAIMHAGTTVDTFLRENLVFYSSICILLSPFYYMYMAYKHKLP